jgi:RNA polymerase primary sigma factor
VTQHCDYQYILEKLYTLYKEKGFLSEEEALLVLSSNNASLVEINQITNKLFAMGVLFSFDNQDENAYSDFGFVDYNRIYKEIILIDKKLKHLIYLVKKIKPPQRKEFDNLYLQAKSSNIFAKNRIIEMNMRQAVRQALYFHKRFSYPLDECIQEAFLGLVIGFDHFEINKSLKFNIHITWWIRQNLYREVLVGNYLIRVPSHFKSQMYKVIKLFKEKYESGREKNIIISKIIKKISCSKENAINIYKCFQSTMDIDHLIDKNEVLFSDNGQYMDNMMEKMTNYLLNKNIKDVLSTISRRESEIFCMRFGIDRYENLTLDDVGNYFGVTRERIRQIEAKALRRLRHPKRSRMLVKFLPEYVNRELSDKDLSKKEKFIE